MGFAQRFDSLRKHMAQKDLQYILVLPGHNFRYLTGLNFDPLERISFLLLGSEQGDDYLFLPKVESSRVETLRRLNLDFHVFLWSDETGPQHELDKLRNAIGQSEAVIGVEYNTMTLGKKKTLAPLLEKARIADATGIFSRLRLIKDSQEIEQFTQANTISDTALQNVIQRLKPGMTEVEIANQLKIELLKLGSEALPVEFKPIVATGANAANPHTRASDTPIAPGQTLLIDTGACWEGYAIDITRTFLLSPVVSEIETIYTTVLAANEAALKKIAPGVTPEQLDQEARAVITQSGYGEYFVHRTGHGIGLEEHEPPWIVEGNTEPLEPGMVFTIEPGIYIPGFAGVRIEENVLVTEHGSRLITQYPKILDDVLVKL